MTEPTTPAEADTAGPRSRSRASSSRRRKSLLARMAMASALFAVLLVAISTTTVYAAYKHYNGQIHHEDVLNTSDTNIKSPEKQLKAANYLVIGSDSRAGANGSIGGDAGNTSGARSDTTMIVHLSPDRTRATVVSIPRDSWVTIPSCTDSTGKTVPAHADMFNSAITEGGAACTIATVQKITGIAITHYVEIDFQGFIKVINALGSITVCSPEVVNDDYSGLKLNVGNNQLNGTQALAYVRARETLGDGSDLGRIKRQQRFLGAILREVRGGKLLSSPTTLTNFLDAATKSITVDKATSITDLKTLFDAMRGLDPAKVTFYTAPIANSAYDPDNPSSTSGNRVLLDDAQGRVLYDEIINDATITVGGTKSPTSPAPSPSPTAKTLTVAPTTIRVQVTNGVGTANLATDVSAALTGIGFQAGTLNLDPSGATTTVVKYAPSQFAAAQTVSAALPNSTMQVDPAHTGDVEVVVGTAYTGVQSVKAGDAIPSWVSTAAPASTAATTPSPTGGITAADSTCTDH